jgi:YrbI family 3-deoxy-D-manno-octulosonate 8-phosphate phosphatase
LHKPFPTLGTLHTVAIDFDGVLTDNKVWLDQDGRELVRCDRADGFGFDLVRAFQRQRGLDVEFFIISKEANAVVSARARKLRLACHQAVSDKLTFMTTYLADRFPSQSDAFTGLAYLGNDLNDLPLMRRAGFAVAPADAHPKIREVAHFVLEQRGGEGFLRAFVERLLDINNLSIDELDELISNC